MSQIAMTLWQAIDAVSAQIPLSVVKIERTLATTLCDTHPPGDDMVQFFEGTPVRLADGVEVSGIDLRIRREGPRSGFLVLALQGRCVSLAEIRQRYANLILTESPRGRSLEEATGHSVTLGWGSLSFGFKERNPACLAFVAFDPS